MNHAEMAYLGNDELYEVLKDRNAPILSHDTTKLGDLFGMSFHGYSMLQSEFEKSSFGDELYTDQHGFPSMAYQRNLHLAQTPNGAGKAPDLLHTHLRLLGLRIANVFMPEIRKLIGDEAIVRKYSNVAPGRERLLIKDRPPNEEAKKILSDANDFTVEMRDTTGKKHVIPIKNEHTRQFTDSPSFSVLETALALREQSIEAFRRNMDTFKWIRDVISLQSVKTMVQVQNIIENGIQSVHPEKSLSDFSLTVHVKQRLDFARAVYERSHEGKRDHVLSCIIDNGSKRSNDRATARQFLSIGESPEGFDIETPQDAAAVLFVMPRSFDLLQYRFRKGKRENIVLSEEETNAFRTIASKIFKEESNPRAAAHIRANAELIVAAENKRREITQRSNLDLIEPKDGIGLACSLLRSMTHRTLWLPESILD